MADRVDIYADLTVKAAAVATALSLPAAFTDDNFEPPIDGNGMILPYLRFDFFNNAPFWEGIRQGRLDQGLSQVTLVVSRPHDRLAAYNYIDAIIAAYPKASVLPGDAKVKIQAMPWVASPIVEVDRTSYPVTVSWVC